MIINHTPTTQEEYKAIINLTANTLETINGKSYNPLLTQLINAKHNDIHALKFAKLTTDSRTQDELITELNTEITETLKGIKRLSTSQADRDELDELLTQALSDRATAREERDTLNSSRVIDCTLSDLMDNVQEFILNLLLSPRPKDYTKATQRHSDIMQGQANSHTANIDPYIMPQLNASLSALTFYENDEELQAEFIEELAHYYNAKSSISRHIHSNKNPNALNGTRTDHYTATAEQINQWIAQGHEIGDSYHITAKNGDKISLILKDGLLQFRKQHKTIKQCISYENYTTENGENLIDGYINSYNILIDSTGAQERIERVLDIVNPTERERNIINYYFSIPAETTENKAHIKYYNEHRHTAENRRALKEFYKMCNTYATAERVKYAVKRETKLDKDNSLNKVWNRLVKHFNECITDINTIMPKDTAQPTDFDYYNALMQTNRGTAQATSEHRADLIQWAEESHTAEITDKVIKWIESGRAIHTITAEERRAEEQADRDNQTLRLIYSARLDTFKVLRDANKWNSKGTYNARYSAFTFFNSLTESEQLKSTELRLYEQSQAKAKAEQMKQHKTPSVDEWHKMSRADKDKYIIEFNKLYR